MAPLWMRVAENRDRLESLEKALGLKWVKQECGRYYHAGDEPEPGQPQLAELARKDAK